MDPQNNPYLANRPPAPEPQKLAGRLRPQPKPLVGPNAEVPGAFARKVKKWAIFALCCCFWIYLEWTVAAKLNVELRDGAKFRMVKDSALWGWVDFNKESGEATFRLGNTGPSEIDFAGTKYFILMKNRARYELDFRKINGIFHSQEFDASTLPPQSGDTGVLIRCAMPIDAVIMEKGVPPPERIRGFHAVFKDGKTLQFGYKRLNYVQKIQKFISMKGGFGFHPFLSRRW